MLQVSTRVTSVLLAGVLLALATTVAQAAPDARRHPRVDAHEGEVVSVRFVPERDLLVSAGADGRLRLWNVPDLSPSRDLHRFPNGVMAMDVSHDGFRVVASDSRSRLGLVTLWGDEARQPPLVQTIPGGDVVLDLAFLSGDRRILGLMLNPVGTGPAARVFEGRTLEADRWFEPRPVASPVCMALDAASTLLSSVHATGVLARWKIPQSQPARYRALPKALTAVTCTPDGTTVIMGDEGGGLYVVTEQRKEPVKMWNLQEPIRALAMDPKGQWLAIGTGRPSRRDLYSRTSLSRPWQRPQGGATEVRLVSLEAFMGGTGNGPLPEARTASFEGPVGGTLTVTFSRNGNHLAVGGADGSVHLWNIASDKLRVRP